MPTDEVILIRTVGGPFPGDRQGHGWPPPETLPDPEGRGEYVKVRQSALPMPVKHVIRGAEYAWRPIEGAS